MKNTLLAAYTPRWEEGGFSKYVQQENQWINYSNVICPVMGSTSDVGSSRTSDIVQVAGTLRWVQYNEANFSITGLSAAY